MIEESRRDRRTRPRRGNRVARLLLGVILLTLAFLVGIAFARTLDERDEQGGVVTNVRTLAPLPQEPPVRTVTVTVTSP